MQLLQKNIIDKVFHFQISFTIWVKLDKAVEPENTDFQILGLNPFFEFWLKEKDTEAFLPVGFEPRTPEQWASALLLKSRLLPKTIFY